MKSDWRNPPDEITFSLGFTSASIGLGFYKAMSNAPLECFTMINSDGSERPATTEERQAYLRELAAPIN